MFRIKVGGIGEFRTALNRVARTMDPAKIRRNVRTIGRAALSTVRENTPGRGTLRDGWLLNFSESKSQRSTTYRFRITNRLANKPTFYISAYDKKRRPKLNADGSPVKWKQVIRYLDEGTRPHDIYPRRYKFLIFNVKQPRRNPVTGRFQSGESTVFAKHVRHPGTVAYGMLSKTREELRQLAESAVRVQRREVIDAWRRK